LIRRGCTAEAVPVLRAALDANPHRFELLANLGMLELQLQDDEQAEHHLRRAIAIDWNHGVLHESLAILLLERDAYAEARGEFEVALALRPTSVRALEGLGAALLGQNEPAAALEAFDAVMQKRRPDAGLHVYRAMALIQLGRDLEGYAGLQQAGQVRADHPGLARKEADCLLRAGDWGGAALAFARAVAEKEEPGSWTGLGRASDLLGDAAFAQACLERALALDACHADASYALAEVLAARGDSREAATQLARAAHADPARISSGLRSVRQRASAPLTLEQDLMRVVLAGSDDGLARALLGRDDDR
jgi:Flp pilus assembly protein TadD